MIAERQRAIADDLAAFVAFAGDQQILDEPLVADGSLQRLAPGPHESCEGGTRSRWSTDGQRVFTNAEVQCPGSAPQLTSGLSTIMRDGRWLELSTSKIGKTVTRN